MLSSKQGIRVLLFFFMVAFLGSRAIAADLSDNKYIIGPGDVLDISVWKNSELSKMVTVLPDGYVAFPLVGEVKAAGKTLAQFKEELAEKIIEFIPNPSLSVIIQNVNMKIFIVGKVKKPGMYGLKENTNVLQALTMASGLNPFAKRNEIKILRKIGNETKIYGFMYDDVSAGRNLEQNIDVVRGDVIVVP